MTKQNFISMSLESGLKYVDLLCEPDDNICTRKGILNGFYCDEHGNVDCEINDCMPILRPLSDLHKEIEHGGEKLIVQNEIDKIRKGVLVYKPINDTLPIELEFDTDDYSQTIDLYDGFLIIQILIKYHFDVLGLIDSGRAIDINTLETNPYK